MNEPKLLSTERLEMTLSNLGDEYPSIEAKLRGHISALEKSLDAARADVADLKRRLSEEQEEVELKQAALNGLAQLKTSGQVAEDVDWVETILNALDASDETKVRFGRLAARAHGYEAAVAEDVERVRRILPNPGTVYMPGAQEATDALVRLTAKAQGYESTVAERDALAKFKAYVHQRLDEAAVPTHPNGPHSAAGCRIGDRMDILVAERAAAVADNAALVDALELIWRHVPHAHFNATGVKALLDAPHPGAALLEEHEKETQQAYLSGVSITSAALLEEHRKALSDLEHMKRQRAHVAALLGVADGGEWQNDWDAPVSKALARARNEGREQIATWLWRQWGEHELAERARAMKEPEE